MQTHEIVNFFKVSRHEAVRSSVVNRSEYVNFKIKCAMALALDSCD